MTEVLVPNGLDKVVTDPELTGSDYHLVQIELDPEQARFLPALSGEDLQHIETAIDAVYIAASAGDWRAQDMIKRSAELTVMGAGIEVQAYEPVDDDYIVSTFSECPTTPLISLQLLDTSIAKIELIIEDAASGNSIEQ